MTYIPLFLYLRGGGEKYLIILFILQQTRNSIERVKISLNILREVPTKIKRLLLKFSSNGIIPCKIDYSTKLVILVFLLMLTGKYQLSTGTCKRCFDF